MDILVISIERVPVNARKSNLQLNKMDEGAFRNVSIRNDFNNYRVVSTMQQNITKKIDFHSFVFSVKSILLHFLYISELNGFKAGEFLIFQIF